MVTPDEPIPSSSTRSRPPTPSRPPMPRGTFPAMPIDAADGYIHFSTAAQLPETLWLYFAGQGDLVFLAVRAYDLGKGLRLGALARRPALPARLWRRLAAPRVAWTAVDQRRRRWLVPAAGGRQMIFSRLSPLLRVPLVASLTREALLRMDPETAHGATINALRLGLAPEQDRARSAGAQDHALRASSSTIPSAWPRASTRTARCRARSRAWASAWSRSAR